MPSSHASRQIPPATCHQTVSSIAELLYTQPAIVRSSPDALTILQATAQGGYSIRRKDDPYTYQVGFGNSFTSEAIPGGLPVGQNTPQKHKWGLYPESLNGTPFTNSRETNERTWIYRIRPAVAHAGFHTSEPQNPNLEAEFSLKDPTQHVIATQLTWAPLEIPKGEKVTFVYGLKTILGNGSPLTREGLAIHQYACNASMEKTAFVNSDGDFLIVPSLGRLDIQTELGKLMVYPGEIAVVQRGIRWKVGVPDGQARGYVQEIFGSHYELPELGPLGSNGLANVRDFEHPIAHFDLDQTQWEIIYKLGGRLHTAVQDHTPFDVVAWHGNYVPYKYDLESFVTVGSISKDHMDPSIFTVLTAKSKTNGVALADFAVFEERWDVADHTFRPPYFHRNTCSEIIGLVKGEYGGRSEDFVPGGLSYEAGFTPHGVDENVYNAATQNELKPMKVGVGSIMVMFETSMMVTVTDFGFKNKKGEHAVDMWDGLGPKFLAYTDQINAELKAAGRPPLSAN
ncbi:homogentisate 1,2-dioxygenase [Trametopsis cervina]|nr:homogentisate 1,2-dioxygenase [Trametopsis cervina]